MLFILILLFWFVLKNSSWFFLFFFDCSFVNLLELIGGSWIGSIFLSLISFCLTLFSISPLELLFNKELSDINKPKELLSLAFGLLLFLFSIFSSEINSDLINKSFLNKNFLI